MILSLSRNGSTWLILLLRGTIFFFDIRCLTSLSKDSAYTILNIATWIISTSMIWLSCYHYEALSILFSSMFFITNINVMTLVILVQIDILSWSLVNTDFSWICIVFTLINFFSSRSSIGTSLISHFCNQHCFLTHRNVGPLNHLFISFFIFESKPWEASSAGLLLLSMKCHGFILV